MTDLRAALAEILPEYSSVEDIASVAAFLLRCIASELPDITGKTTEEIISLAAWHIDEKYGHGVDDPDNRDAKREVGRKATRSRGH